MIRVTMSVLAAVTLAAPFGSASAELLDREPTVMTIDLEVEVQVSVQAVVAHLNFDREPELTIPLLDRGGGVFGINTELAPRNYVVVFEAVGPDGGLSAPATLHQLGVDLVSGTSGTATTKEEGLTDTTRRTGWLALAFAAASLSALAVWVLGGRDEDEEEPGRTEEE